MPRLLLAVVLVGCGLSGCGGSAPASDPSTLARPAADPAPCADASRNAVKFLDKDMPADRVQAVMTERCTADKWQVETRTCLLTAKSLQELDGCTKSFTPDQDAAFERDLEKLDPGPGPTTAAGAGANTVGTPPPSTPPSNVPPPNIPPPAGSMPK